MLEIRDVRKAFGATVALDGLSLQVRRGEIFGLLRPDAGSVAIEGASPADPATRRRIGLAPQALALYDTLTGRENLEFFARLQGLSGARLRTRVDAALEFVALADRQDDRVGGFSGGMKRRLNLAAALLHEPDLVLLDEPTAGVDPQSRNALFDNVEELRAQGRTVVYTTHYMEEVERLCDRIAIVDHGRVLAIGTLAELLAAHGGPPMLVARRGERTWREPVADPLARLNEIAADGPLDDFRVEPPRLEQVFLHLTGRQLRD